MFFQSFWAQYVHAYACFAQNFCNFPCLVNFDETDSLRAISVTRSHQEACFLSVAGCCGCVAGIFSRPENQKTFDLSEKATLAFLGCWDRSWADLCPLSAIQVYCSLHIHLVSTKRGTHIQDLLSNCHHQTRACRRCVGQLEDKAAVPSKVITDAPKPSSLLSRGSHLTKSEKKVMYMRLPKKKLSHEKWL